MGKLSMWGALRDQFTELELVEGELTGKTIIVTGANIGLGFETSKHLARMKPGKLILACRDLTRAEEAAKQIREETQIGDELVVWSLDLAEFGSVSAFASKFEKEGGGRLDLLVENAAIATHDYQQTRDGWERTLQINHLSTALLAFLLLPIQIKTQSSGPTPRLVIVSSDMHYMASAIDGYAEPCVLEYINKESYCTPAHMGQRYNVSKLSVTPGFCHSSLTRDAKGARKIAIDLSKYIFGRTTEMGSRAIVWAALGGNNDGVNGKYLNNCRVSEESDWSLGAEGRKMESNVWKETIEILKKVDPRVDAIVEQHLIP